MKPEPETEVKIITISGVRYHVLSESCGPYVRVDGKREIAGLRYASVVPC